ncbi:hypothetical protein [Roseovarius halotolerans]|nr:hypothetical protein [Roseovarius halotolerans]
MKPPACRISERLLPPTDFIADFTETVLMVETMKQYTSEAETEILNLVLRERSMAVSEREWQHRLRGYGYAIRDTTEGRIVTSLVRGSLLCSLPAHAA